MSKILLVNGVIESDREAVFKSWGYTPIQESYQVNEKLVIYGLDTTVSQHKVLTECLSKQSFLIKANNIEECYFEATVVSTDASLDNIFSQYNDEYSKLCNKESKNPDCHDVVFGQRSFILYDLDKNVWKEILVGRDILKVNLSN